MSFKELKLNKIACISFVLTHNIMLTFILIFPLTLRHLAEWSVCNELYRAKKEVVVAECERKYLFLPCFVEGAHENVKITDSLAESWMWDRPNTQQDCQLLGSVLG